jgi:hypothetical protein
MGSDRVYRGRGLPNQPRSRAAQIKVFELLFILKRIHARPKPRIRIGDELLISDQALEWFSHQLFSIVEITTDLSPEGKETTVHPRIRRVDVLDALHEIVHHRDYIETLVRLHTEKASRFLSSIK